MMDQPMNMNAGDQVPEAQDRASILERLDALGRSLSGTRKKAIDGRSASGIESDWTEDEEYYEGIDDLNRGQGRSTWNSKPPGQAMLAASKTQSTVFPNITRPYVDAAASKVGDILLPTDDRPWSLAATPVTELAELAKGRLPDAVSEGMLRDNVPLKTQEDILNAEVEFAQKMIDEAEKKAKKAEKRIEDWMIEGQWHAEMRKVIDDATRLGTGVIKGPVPVSKRSIMYKDNALVMVDEIKPVSKRIDPWNLFPDPACGESIHNGAYIWERDFITPKKLDELKRDHRYIAENIDRCLQEGPKNVTSAPRRADGGEINKDDLFEIWYFHGQAGKEDLEAAGCECKSETTSVPAMIVMVNDCVIKGALNPLDIGEFPYDSFTWQRRKGMPWGTGVARQVRTPQQIVLAATRALLTNAGRAAGPIIVRMDNIVIPVDGSMDIVPWKQYTAAEGTDDVRKAFTIFEIPDRQNSLAAIIQYGMKLAEDVTGLPLLLQGQAGNAPETFGGQQLVEKNASGVLRRIARTVDDCITEPHVRRYYAWLLQYGEDDEKGEFVIDARGSTSLVERELYRNEVNQLLQASLQPAFGLDPELVMAEHLRVEKKIPKDFQLSDEKKAAMMQQQQQPQDPALQVAEVRIQGEMEKVKLVKGAEIEKAQLNQQSDMEELRFKAMEAKAQREHEMAIQQRIENIEMMKLAQSQNVSIAQIKAELAGTAMKLKVQKELSAVKGPQVASPPMEPRGRAPKGQAFQR